MRHSIWLFGGTLVALLAACGGDKSTNGPGDNTGNPNEPVVPDYTALKWAEVSAAPLSQVGEAQTAEHIKNGIRLSLSNSYYPEPGAGGGSNWSSSGWVNGSSASSSSSSSSSSSGGFGGSSSSAASSSGSASSSSSGGTPADGGNFTETNVHVAGVDEADWVKYDGEHWFISTRSGNQFNPVNVPTIDIAKISPATADAEFVGRYQYDDGDLYVQLEDFYLLGDEQGTTHLASIRNHPGNVPETLPGWQLDLAAPANFFYQPVNGAVLVDLIDVENPAEPESAWRATIDGTLVESRKIGDVLYLVTRFDPWLDGVAYDIGDAAQREANEEILAAAEYDDLVPHIAIGNTRKPLTKGCLFQGDVKPEHGFSSLVHITAIDLAQQKVLSSQCLNSNVEVLSMTEKSLYITGTVYDAQNHSSTTIHKFNVSEDGLTYSATGNVAGGMGWLADPVFRMHEFEKDFRIVTTATDFNGPEHHLYILEEKAGALKVVASLPNAQRPEAIGKPWEHIRAVRFDDKNAYIVTFVQTDPLYKIDLTDRTDPKIAGELEIPGFATYMHPVGDHYLFTLGQEADAAGRVTGLKAELIDVSGDDPVVAGKLILGDNLSSSEALANLRALNILERDDGTVRIAFPLTVYQTRVFGGWSSSSSSSSGWAGSNSSSDVAGLLAASSSSSSSSSSSTTSSSSTSTGGWSSSTSSSGGFISYVWAWSGLKLLEITGVDGTAAQLRDAGEIKAAGDTLGGQNSAYSRGLLHDDAVYLTFDSAIWAAFWGEPETARGPIVVDPDL